MRFDVSDFNLLNQMIYTDDRFTQMLALIGIRKLLSIENTPPIQSVIDANLVPIFIIFLHHEIPKFQFESAWCLTNIASGSSDQVNCLLEKEVVQNFNLLLGCWCRQALVENGLGEPIGRSRELQQQPT